MIADHKGYHRRINEEMAEERLKLSGRHCYLTRYSEKQKCYFLSVYEPKKPKATLKHFEIIIRPGLVRIKKDHHNIEDYSSIDDALPLTYMAYSRDDWERDLEPEPEPETYVRMSKRVRGREKNIERDQERDRERDLERDQKRDRKKYRKRGVKERLGERLKEGSKDGLARD